MLTYGDSITYGASAAFPSNRHCFRLSEALGVAEVCKAIGGEVFCPDLLTEKKEKNVGVISVAYGTNEIGTDFESFQSRSTLFFERLMKTYPETPVFVLAPIWRKECEMPEHIEKIKMIKRHLEALAALYENAFFIDCIDFVPHDPAMYTADCLHPSDMGFEHYYKNLKKDIFSIFKDFTDNEGSAI